MPKTISREEYKALLDAGYTSRGAGLYEAQHRPAKEQKLFVYVQLTPQHRVYKRMFPPGKGE